MIIIPKGMPKPSALLLARNEEREVHDYKTTCIFQELCYWISLTLPNLVSIQRTDSASMSTTPAAMLTGKAVRSDLSLK